LPRLRIKQSASGIGPSSARQCAAISDRGEGELVHQTTQLHRTLSLNRAAIANSETTSTSAAGTFDATADYKQAREMLAALVERAVKDEPAAA
jgi:hypothetical protein